MKAPEITPASKVGLTLASLAAVLWLVVLQVDRVSPGPLAMAHQQDHELADPRACERCHGETAHDMAAACNECHTEIGEQLRTRTGFHGDLENPDGRMCAACHGEHAGVDFPLVSRQSFALAGFVRREDFDHAELDFLLQGRHTELGCVDCHANADVVLLAAGEQRFLGLDQGCQSCHEDVHEGRIVRACVDCHGQEHPFSLVARFRHDEFTSECAHAAPDCATCHPAGSQHDSELLAGADPPDCRRTCAECHDSPHSEPFTQAAAVLADVPAGDSCEECHSEAHGSFGDHPEAMPAFLHAASGFDLGPPHATAECADCHAALAGDALEAFVVQQPPRAAHDCRTCHGDPHRGQFERGAFAGADCLDCHTSEAFEPSQFGLEEHARSAFALVEAHQAVACSECHVSDPPGSPRVFQGTPDACSACHEDAHRGAMDEGLAALGLQGDCAHCHAPTSFAEHDEDAFVHADWTGFALDGAHARNECTTCHRPSRTPDEHGRTFGFVADLHPGDPRECTTCHADPHDGRFDRPEVSELATLGGVTGCARCHTTESFSEPPADFAHELWTGYPMAAFHADVECVACHVPRERPDAAGRTFGLAPTRCADCHADPHVGQFAREGVTDCARCHQDSGGNWFDHQVDSRFALDERHAALECSACHVPWPLEGGGEAVRYKPLGTECVDCHDPDFLEREERRRPRRPTPAPGPGRRGR